jgi:hypothetical protein
VVSTADAGQDFPVAGQCPADFIWTADSDGLVTFGAQTVLHRIGQGGKVTSLPLVPGAWDHPRSEPAATAIRQAEEVVRQATADYDAGQASLDDLQLREGRELLTRAADAFAALPERFPAARFVQADLDLYAQHLRGLAAVPEEEVKLRVACKRLDRIAGLLQAFRAEGKRFPPDLPALLQWAIQQPSYAATRDQIPSWFRDPDAPAEEALSLHYTPEAADGPRPAVIVTAPRRPGMAVVINDRDWIYLEVGPEQQ